MPGTLATSRLLAPRRLGLRRPPRRTTFRPVHACVQNSSLPPAFPLSKVVNHAAAKAALVLAAVDPRVGGVALIGGHGTCKSTLARAVREILPPIQVVPGSYCNEPPKEPTDKTPEADAVSGYSLRAAPFLTIPLGATEDAVCGSIDLEESAKVGTNQFSPGILARANRGVLFLDDLSLLDDAVVNLTLSAVDAGFNLVEREGISTKHACHVLTIAAVNPTEGEVRSSVLDRFAAVVGVDETLELSDRVKATEVSSQWKDDWRAVLRECADEEEQLRLDVVLARARLANGTVAVPHSAIEYLVERAMKGRCRGHRAEICAAKFARAAAALRGGSRVEKQDLLVAVELAIRPRDTVEVEDDLGDDDEEMPNQDEAAEEDPEEFAETGTGETEAETDDTDDTTDDDTDETPDLTPDEPPPTLSPDQLVFKPDESALAAFAAELLSAFEKSAKKRRRHETGGSPANRSKSKNKTKSLERGRYVKAEFPKGGVVRKIAIDATLRAASVHQLQRRKNRGVSKSSKRIFITKDDLRNKRMSRKSSSLTVFLVDASGSMALHRFDVAKGAALLLLASSFSKRDQIAVVSYGGDFARVVLPPSRSLRLAKTRLSELPSGGGTPLAHGLVTAGRVAYASSKFKQNVGSAKVVLLTDGGCNVTLERSNEAERFSTVTTLKSYTPISSEIPSKAFLRNQAVAVAGTLGKRGVRVFVVDCSRRFAVENFAPSSGIESTMKDPQEALPKQLAQAARGSYYRLAPNLDAKRAGETLAGVLDA